MIGVSPGAQGGGGLRLHVGVGLAMVRTAFAVADDDVGRAGVLEHLGGNVARVSAAGGGMAILPAKAQAVRAPRYRAQPRSAWPAGRRSVRRARAAHRHRRRPSPRSPQARRAARSFSNFRRRAGDGSCEMLLIIRLGNRATGAQQCGRALQKCHCAVIYFDISGFMEIEAALACLVRAFAADAARGLPLARPARARGSAGRRRRAGALRSAKHALRPSQRPFAGEARHQRPHRPQHRLSGGSFAAECAGALPRRRLLRRRAMRARRLSCTHQM